MINLDPIVDQLNEIYFNHEYWIDKKISIEEISKYHRRMIEAGNLIYYEESGEVRGYVEFWRLNYEQFGRIICHVPFSAYQENVQDGNICYVANVWIKENYRNTGVFKVLMYLFYKQNHHCEYYVGEAFRKKSAPVKVFKKADLKSRLFKEGY